MFVSAFLILTAVVRQAPWAAALAGIGTVIGTWALLSRAIALCLGPPTPDVGPAAQAALLPAWLLLLLVLAAGVALPAPVSAWLGGIAGATR